MSRPKRSNHVHVTLPGTPPPPKTWKTPAYRLDHYNIRRHTQAATAYVNANWNGQSVSNADDFTVQ